MTISPMNPNHLGEMQVRCVVASYVLFSLGAADCFTQMQITDCRNFSLQEQRYIGHVRPHDIIISKFVTYYSSKPLPALLPWSLSVRSRVHLLRCAPQYSISRLHVSVAMRDHHEAPPACHNCRRQRLKCDRSAPQCRKCISRGQACLGYQRLLRWETGLASRGKLTGKTFQSLARCQQAQPPYHNVLSIQYALDDPVIQDLSQVSRQYLRYCKLFASRSRLVETSFQREVLTGSSQSSLMSVVTWSYTTRQSTIVSVTSFQCHNVIQAYSRSLSLTPRCTCPTCLAIRRLSKAVRLIEMLLEPRHSPFDHCVGPWQLRMLRIRMLRCLLSCSL